VARRVSDTEANTSGSTAVALGRHGRHSARLHTAFVHSNVRKPSRYTTHDVELLLTALWNMFTEHQARRVVVTVPWDESDEPTQMALSELANLLESWLE
jgi:hypothetical protein